MKELQLLIVKNTVLQTENYDFRKFLLNSGNERKLHNKFAINVTEKFSV